MVVLKNILRKTCNFIFIKHYWIFLMLVVLISYGQILGMQPWQDDNALFFKLAHIQEPAGVFGPGPLGAGLYKYGAVPFIPIYTLFGFNTVAYFALILFLYVITTLVVYKLFSKILGENGGKVAGFIYAAGYITSDAFYRMANGATTDISIILVSLFILSYWKFYKDKRGWYYFLALIFFFLAVHYSVVRDHYLVAIAVFFEFIFLALRKPLKSIYFSLVRLIPFVYIFYRLVASTGDTRVGGVKDFILSIFKGQLFQTYGFITSLSNLIIPDYLTNLFYEKIYSVNLLLQLPFSLNKLSLFLISAVFIYLLFKNEKKRKFLLSVFYLILFIWFFVSGNIYSVPIINPGDKQLFIAALGGILVIISVGIFLILKKGKDIFLFLFLWLIANTFAYATYFPTVTYETISRYLAHSFLAYAGILGFLFYYFQKKGMLGRLFSYAILLMGVLNIFNAAVYQNGFLKNKSYPVKNFYSDLAKLLPKIDKNDILYFDISNDAKSYYRDAATTAMMPDTTSFAWRYGVDRYDFFLTTDFSELMKTVSDNKINQEKIHAFWYSKDALKDNSEEVRKYFLGENTTFQMAEIIPQTSSALIKLSLSSSIWQQSDVILDLNKPLRSVTPTEMIIKMTAFPLQPKNIKFPLYFEGLSKKLNGLDLDETILATRYQLLMNDFTANPNFEVSSEWQDRVGKNLYDNNPETVWQSDRILWGKEMVYIKTKLPYTDDINRVYWTSSTYRGGIPSATGIDISIDGISWQEVKGQKFLNSEDTTKHIITFEPILARYVRMRITETIGGDSPMVAEFRVIPTSLAKLDLFKADDFLNDPFLVVPDERMYGLILSGLRNKGKVKIYWFGDKEKSWETSKETELEIVYDGRSHEYRFILPAGGTYISEIKIADINIPGTIILSGLRYRQHVQE